MAEKSACAMKMDTSENNSSDTVSQPILPKITATLPTETNTEATTETTTTTTAAATTTAATNQQEPDLLSNGKTTDSQGQQSVPPLSPNADAAAKEWVGLRIKMKTLAKFSILYEQIKNTKSPTDNVIAGHKDQFLFTRPGILCKKSTDFEKGAFESLMQDVLRDFVPLYYTEVSINDEVFLEMQDLLHDYNVPTIMDIKMGSRTFLESEVKNQTLRPDLLQKMIDVDPSAPTEEEMKQGGIKKLRYMQFREQQSSTMNLGFRIEGMKLGSSPPTNDFKTVQTANQVAEKLCLFMSGSPDPDMKHKFLNRLEKLRTAQESSSFFMAHQLISSSLLFAYDQKGRFGVWMIDFAKTIKTKKPLTHRNEWVLGNEEDGYLWGLDNLIDLWKNHVCNL